MRRSHRINQGNHDLASTGDARAAAPAPTTPHRARSGATLNELILKLESEWQIGLRIRPSISSPTTRPNDLADKVYAQIQRWFYKDQQALDSVCNEFRQTLKSCPPQGRLDRFSSLLKNTADLPNSRGSRTLSNDRSEPQEPPLARLPRPLRLRGEHDENGSESNLLDPGSATEEEDDDDDDCKFFTPPSASPSPSRSALQRRGQVDPSLTPSKKRRSDLPDNDRSPKLSKPHRNCSPQESSRQATVESKRAVESIFKMPVVPLPRSFKPSFQSNPSSKNTSFNSVWSQETMVDSAATSFMSDGTCEEQPQKQGTELGPGIQFRLDAVMGSQEAGQDRLPSTYGSIDEEECERLSDELESGSRSVSANTSTSSNISAIDAQASSGQQPTLKEAYQIRDLPHHDLFQGKDCVEAFKEASSYSTSERFWTVVSEIIEQSVPKAKLAKREGNQVWRAQQKKYDGYTFKGQLNFNRKKSEPVFTLQVLPIMADKSCRLQRKFDAHRFFYITVPSFDRQESGRFNQLQMQQISSRWKQWLGEVHHFCGRAWKAFHVEPTKSKNKKQQGATHDKRVVLFAISGIGIVDISVGSMLNWFLPFSKNAHQTMCKAYSRIDLALSRTVPTLTFRPSQVRYTEDIRSNGELETTEFNDPALKWPLAPANQVMNDGCARMSVAAARQVWRIYREVMGISGTQALPTAFQGRIGGAKGMWFVSSETFSSDPKDQEIWIEVNESQLKIVPHDEDTDCLNDNFDRLRLTFEVRHHSTTPSASELHISFIPILLDRGVPLPVIENKMKGQLEVDRVNLLQALKDPVRIYEWIHKNGAKSGFGIDILWQAALPISNEEKIKLMLESGFLPSESAYVAKVISRYIQKYHVLKESKLRTLLGRSTMLYGIADPHGVLKPGEVQLRFSSQFVVESADEAYQNLSNIDVLVARQPACRRSDIQRVRAVTHPKLSHPRDVIVFSTVGDFPLAGKLQGGDYDGDRFWVCWEDDLVSQFKNAPAPVVAPDPINYGIKVNKRRLDTVMKNPEDLSTVDRFLHEAFEFRSTPSFLGQVSTLLENLAYREGQVSSETLDHLCDMHDLLVDAPKQGYTYTQSDFDKMKKNVLKKNFRSLARLEKPAYKAAMEDCAAAKDADTARRKRAKDYNGYVKERSLDYLYFNVCRAHHVATGQMITKGFSKALSETQYIIDGELAFQYNHQKDKNDPVIDEELRLLKEQFREELSHKWNGFFNNSNGNDAQANKVTTELYETYLAIQPSQPERPSIKAWLEPSYGSGQTLWNIIKASTLYSMFPRPRHSDFVFKMAGEELTKLKAMNAPGRCRVVIAPIHANMKPKKIKTPVELDQEEIEDIEEEEDNDEELA